jgi:glutamyl-tRNA synthetase
VEWFPSLPLHVVIWKAFEWKKPLFAHLPVLLNPNGQGKISKRNPPRDRHGNPIPVMVHDYIAAGYLPEAVINFLANIGWAFGDDREVFSIPEAIERFDGTRINPANSAFPIEKLEWLNGVYIRDLPVDELARRVKPYLEAAGLQVDEAVLQKVTPLIRERIKTLKEAIGMVGFVFRSEIAVSAEELIQKSMDAESTAQALRAAHETLAELPVFTAATQEPAMRGLAERLGLKPGQLFGAVRVAVTGQTVSPPLFETMEVLGREVCLDRILQAAEMLEAQLASK